MKSGDKYNQIEQLKYGRKKILIRSTNWIGDAVMTTPAVRSIRTNFPDANIYILAKPWVAHVFEHSPNIDSILIYDGNGTHKGNWGKLRLAREIATHRFDAVILLQNAIEAALISLLAKIPIRIGFDTDGRKLLLTHPVRCTSAIREVHQTRYYLEILKGIRLTVGSTELSLTLRTEEKERAETLLNELSVPKDAVLAGINPGATFGTAKRWPSERYIDLMNRIKNQYGFFTAVFGGAGEAELGDQICKAVGNKCLNFCGKTTLREAMALIDRCKLFITNDSGLMHIAAALNIPLIAIFGPTDHITTAPLSRFARIVRTQVPCSPCLKQECPADHRCMEEISVDRIVDEVERLLTRLTLIT